MREVGRMFRRKFHRSFLGWYFCLGLLFGWIPAFEATAKVRDEASILSKQLATEIEARIDECEAQSGVELHVVTFAGLDDYLENRSVEMLHEMSGADPAVLLAFGWGMEVPLVKVSPALGDRYPLADLTALLEAALKPFTASNSTLSQKLNASSRVLAEGLSALEKKREVLQSRHFPQELFLSLGAVVLGSALLMWVAGLWLQKSAARHEKWYFPDVEVGLRLGAPYGGGLMVQTSASKKSGQR